MKIYLTEKGFIKNLDEVGFVANSSLGINIIEFYYPGKSTMATISFIRADGIVIDGYVMVRRTEDAGQVIYTYTIVEGDGVLGCKGPLKISARIYNTIDNKTSIVATATLTTNVYENITDEENYDAFRLDLEQVAQALSESIANNSKKILHSTAKMLKHVSYTDTIPALISENVNRIFIFSERCTPFVKGDIVRVTSNNAIEKLVPGNEYYDVLKQEVATLKERLNTELLIVPVPESANLSLISTENGNYKTTDKLADIAYVNQKNQDLANRIESSIADFITNVDLENTLNSKDFATKQEVVEISEGKKKTIIYDTADQFIANIIISVDEEQSTSANYYVKLSLRNYNGSEEYLINPNVGDIILIKQTDVPDYWITQTETMFGKTWFDPENITLEQKMMFLAELETRKVDLTDYVQNDELNAALNTKQDKLVSGTNIATINNQSLVDNTSIIIPELKRWLGAFVGSNYYSTVTYANNTLTIGFGQTVYAGAFTMEFNNEFNSGDWIIFGVTSVPKLSAALKRYQVYKFDTITRNGSTVTIKLTDYGYNLGEVDLSTKQDTLVSGTNIKTINNESILGNGNIEIGSSSMLVIQMIEPAGTEASPTTHDSSSNAEDLRLMTEFNKLSDMTVVPFLYFTDSNKLAPLKSLKTKLPENITSGDLIKLVFEDNENQYIFNFTVGQSTFTDYKKPLQQITVTDNGDGTVDLTIR